jgi:quercetin dioxygenase-like cupin family protein
MTYTPALSNHAAVLSAGGGEHFEFLNNRATIKVRAGSEGSMSVVEFLAPKGFGPPLHRHLFEDELFVVFEGELMFHRGEDRIPGSVGSVAYLPRGHAHTFQVLSESSRFLNVTAANRGIPRFDAMVAALGIPTTSTAIPPPMQIDPGHVAEVCAQHDIEILGPPPGPITTTNKERIAT